MFETITTLFRAQVAEAEKATFDANAAFKAGKRDLAMVIAEESGELLIAAEIGTRIANVEAAAVRVLDAGNEVEAERPAERLAGLSDDLKAHQLAASDCADATRCIRKSLESNVRLLGELWRGPPTAKAAAAVDRANQRFLKSAGLSDSAIQKARRTLERIPVRQSEQRNFAEEMDRVERDPTLRASRASVVPRVPVTDPKAVLERLKARCGTAVGSEKTADRSTA